MDGVDVDGKRSDSQKDSGVLKNHWDGDVDQEVEKHGPTEKVPGKEEKRKKIE